MLLAHSKTCPGQAVLQTRLSSISEATKHCRKECSQDLLDYCRVPGDPLVSLVGGSGVGKIKVTHRSTLPIQPVFSPDVC